MFILIPLILAIPTAISWMQEKQRIEIICERQVLAAQENLVAGMNSLIRMNPLVESLVAKKKFFENAVKMATHPAVKAMFAAQLAMIIVKIKALRAQQLAILKTKEASAYLKLTAIKPEVKWHILEMHNLLQTAPLSQIRVTHNKPKIHLQPLFIDRMIPIYKETPQLATLQSLHTHIDIKNFLFPKWIEFLKGPSPSLGSRQNSQWVETCSSTPYKGGIIWESLLGKARPF